MTWHHEGSFPRFAAPFGPMWAYVDDTGGGDDASGWGSNPVRRLFGPGTVRFPRRCLQTLSPAAR